MHFSSDWLVRYMDRKFFTYEDLASRVGVSKNTVYRWCAGRMEPSKHNIIKIADALGVEPEQLMEEDEGVPLSEL